MADLKPCPFCGGKDVDIKWHLPMFGEYLQHFIYCNECGAMSPHKFLESEAIEAWNRRVNDG